MINGGWGSGSLSCLATHITAGHPCLVGLFLLVMSHSYNTSNLIGEWNACLPACLSARMH